MLTRRTGQETLLLPQCSSAFLVVYVHSSKGRDAASAASFVNALTA
jgi:hypothetical protein